ncbi:hypothetical protein JF531_09265 [Microbacterium esteraromaticum]|uniref:hypothetical protein n=1 Tax=Microbacterium esteraromaticum TaxID=57043 RepID=UPI001A8C63F8|nr:hypothetical protein [Microbacterium esteraromaticum]MBN8424709.1 hypothetical protein [Microbacterium esteraromaticum]
MSPNPKRLVSGPDAERIRIARKIFEEYEGEFRAAVIDALLNGASVRAVSEVSGPSVSAVQRLSAKTWPLVPPPKK